jgi:exodeoxyribonuclease-3
MQSFVNLYPQMKTLRIISYNVNGIRAALNKGLLEWLGTHPADIICLQETKAEKENINLAPIHALGYETCWFSAQKKGYSGVAIFTRVKPNQIIQGHGAAISDAEGRVIRADFESFTLINAYFPSGTSGEERQTYKYQWLQEFTDYITALKKEKPNLIVVGDYNIAHREIDIHDPKGNKKSSGFLPEERAWMDKWLEDGWIDSFRHCNPLQTGGYSWWSQRFPSVRLQNKGWRIDYICVTHPMADKIVSASIMPHIKHSDHCPVYMEISVP